MKDTPSAKSPAASAGVGTVLAYNGETEAGAAKLRKAFELYRDLVGGTVNKVEDSPAGYRRALADLATTSLEERVGEEFMRRLRALSGEGATALHTSPP